MIRIITIDREYGSGAGDIARKLAERLSWTLWDERLTNEIARIMECDCRAVEQREEQRDPLRYRLFKSFLRGSFEGNLSAQRVRMVDADCIRVAADRVVREAAREGSCVIVGRGSVYTLQDNPEALHVFIYAPIDSKVLRLQHEGKSQNEADTLVESVDRDRAAYIKQYFDMDWPARDLYHLMVNSAMGDDAVVETILQSRAVLERALAKA
jgi:cytidylate kinase